MNLLSPMFVAGIALVGAAVLLAPDRQPAQSASGAGAVADVDLYHVLESGLDRGCTMAIRDAGGEPSRIRRSGCSGELERASLWAPQRDGSVSLIASDGSILIALAVADGAAFESYGSGERITLVADQ